MFQINLSGLKSVILITHDKEFIKHNLSRLNLNLKIIILFYYQTYKSYLDMLLYLNKIENNVILHILFNEIHLKDILSKVSKLSVVLYKNNPSISNIELLLIKFNLLYESDNSYTSLSSNNATYHIFWKKFNHIEYEGLKNHLYFLNRYKIEKNKRKIYIIGSGSDSFDLLTLKGYYTLLKSDYIFYDRLSVGIDLFNTNNRKVIETFKYPDTNHILVENEQLKSIKNTINSNNVISRLKGGDPGIFAYLNREVQYFHSNKIEVENIPGIPSFIGLIGLLNRSITETKKVRNFTIMTAHSISYIKDKITLMLSTDLLILMMGSKHYKYIINLLTRFIDVDSSSVLIISNGVNCANSFIYDGNIRNSEYISFNNPSVIYLYLKLK